MLYILITAKFLFWIDITQINVQVGSVFEFVANMKAYQPWSRKAKVLMSLNIFFLQKK